MNLPGTTDQHPNWRRKQSLSLEDLSTNPRVRALAHILNSARPPFSSRKSPCPLMPKHPFPAPPIACSSQGFRLRAGRPARAVLAALGVSHLYASPYLKARPGSTHGYDIVDHDALNPELGSEDDFRAMATRCRRTVLAKFSISCRTIWASAAPTTAVARRAGVGTGFGSRRMVRHRLGPGPPLPARTSSSCPFSATSTAPCSRRGGLARIRQQEGSFAVWAYDTHKLPICPLHYARILGDAHPELERLGDAFSGLPESAARVGGARRTQGGAGRARRASDVGRGATRSGGSRRAGPLRTRTPTVCTRLIQRQHWRAAYFQRRGRRHQLSPFLQHQRARRPAHGAAGGVRPRPPLRAPTDRRGTLDGLRIDHIDGLLDPKGYCIRLREKAARPILSRGREDSRAPRAAARGLAGRGHDRLRLHQPCRRTARRSGRRGELQPHLPRVHRAAPRLRGHRPRLQDPDHGNEMASELNVLARDAAPRRAAEPRTAISPATSSTAPHARSSPASRSTAPISTRPARRPRPTGAISTGRSRARGAPSADIDPSVFDFLHGCSRRSGGEAAQRLQPACRAYASR